ncbi:RDD family protein [Streptomyces triticagri]|nr:RDD family protein [Streptomyces triticagri]
MPADADESRAPYATGYLGDRPLHQLASPSRRFGAFLLDEAILAPLPVLLVVLNSGSRRWTTALVLHLVLCALYSPVSTARWGGTPGKLVLGMRVVQAADGQHLSYGRAAERLLTQLAFTCTPLLGALNCLWCCGDRSRCLHDVVVGSLVIRVPWTR